MVDEKKGAAATPVPSAEELQKQLKDSLQKIEVASAAYRELQSRTDREREQMKAQLTEAEHRAEAQATEIMQAVEKHPEVKEAVTAAQVKAKAAQFDQLRQREEQLADAKRQYANLFSVDIEELAAATTPADVLKLALERRDARREEALIARLGIKMPDTSAENQGPPKAPVAQGPSPDANLQSEQEWEQARQELRDQISQTKKMRDRDALRQQYLIRSKRGRGSSRRAQV